MSARARLTPVDVVFFGVAIFVLTLLAEPMYTTMHNRAGALGTGEAYIFQLIFPAAIGTVFVLLIATAASGGTS